MSRTATFRTFLAATVLSAVVLSPLSAADFTRYVSLGDSLTAGVISASIGEVGQLASFPRQLHLRAGSGEFEQPLVSDPGIPARLTLKSLSPLLISPEPGQGSPINLTAPAYQNLGVSGARVSDTLRNGGSNTSHQLVLRGGGTALQQAVAQSPTFVTLWIGNNDVLRAAIGGIVLEGVTLTPLEEFEADYRAIADTLEVTGAELAFANIPNVTTIPYVSTIPPGLVDPVTQEPVLFEGFPIPLLGPNGPLGFGDRVLLPAGAAIAAGDGIPVELGGTGRPLDDTLVLDAEELEMIQERVDAFNRVIRTVAGEKGAALIDMNATFDRVARRGFNVGGFRYTAELFGGLFSFDGVHPSPFGYAIIANEFIRGINRNFGGGIPLVSYVPFVEGGGGIGSVDGLFDTSRTVLTRRAQRNLRRVLDQPSPRRLARLKRRWQAQQD